MAKMRGWVVPAGVVVVLGGIALFGGRGPQTGPQNIWTAEAVQAVGDDAKQVVEAEVEAALPAARELMEQEAVQITDQYLAETVNLLQQADLVADQIRLQSIYQDAIRERDQTGQSLEEILERKLRFHVDEATRIAAEKDIKAYGGDAQSRSLYAANLSDAKLLVQLIAAIKSGQTPVTSELRPQDVWARVDAYLMQARKTRGLMQGDTDE